MVAAVIEGKPFNAHTTQPSTAKERRVAQKIGRRKNKALQASLKQMNLAQGFGNPQGTRTPYFEKGTSSLNGKTSQELSRSNRFQRESDIGTPEQLERLANGRYSWAERRGERKARRRFLAAQEAQRELMETNIKQRDGKDSTKAKAIRVVNRAKRVWKSR